MAHTLTLATRGSKLALAQSEWVRDELCRRNPGLQVELLILKTTGDKMLDSALSQIGGKGLFTREIEEALLDRRADLAVHSLKDLPTDLPEGLIVAAMPERVDPRDVLICRVGADDPDATCLDNLPHGAVVGTCSLRRSAQLAHCRPDLQFKPIRGNVDTRLAKLTAENLDAIVLAGAGLIRLGMADRVSQWLPTAISLPAAGQGIIGIEARADDERTLGLLQSINSPASQACAAAERAALARLGGGCQTPIGLYARLVGTSGFQPREGDECIAEGVVVHLSGDPCYRDRVSGPVGDAAEVGVELADRLLAQGAGALIVTATS